MFSMIRLFVSLRPGSDLTGFLRPVKEFRLILLEPKGLDIDGKIRETQIMVMQDGRLLGCILMLEIRFTLMRSNFVLRSQIAWSRREVFC